MLHMMILANFSDVKCLKLENGSTWNYHEVFLPTVMKQKSWDIVSSNCSIRAFAFSISETSRHEVKTRQPARICILRSRAVPCCTVVRCYLAERLCLVVEQVRKYSWTVFISFWVVSRQKSSFQLYSNIEQIYPKARRSSPEKKLIISFDNN